MSGERRAMLRAYGAQLELTPGIEGMSGAIQRAQAIVDKTPYAYMLQQFRNPANAKIHRETTDEENLATYRWTGRYSCRWGGYRWYNYRCGKILRTRKPRFQEIAVEPANSPVLSGGKAGSHKIQGIGAGFIPQVLNVGLIDEVITVTDEEAICFSRRLAKEEGLLSGISSGAALCAAIRVAQRPENSGRLIVIIQPSCKDL